MIHERPDFVLNFKKPKNTEIKYIKGHWYLYERSSYYDPKTKKMHKKSGSMLGTITESGFVEKKARADKKTIDDVEVIEVGASGYFWAKNTELMDRLKIHFPDYWKELFACAVLRITDGPKFKRLEDAYETSCLSVFMPGLKLDKNRITQILKSVGRKRVAIMDFMKSESDKLSPYLVFDGHRIISDSETLETAQMGYDSRRRFKDQVNLVYAFSVSGERCFPSYYKQFSGDVPDITAFSSLIEEAKIDKENLTILADKGFGSEDNFSLIEGKGFKYIIPIKRTNDDSKDNMPETAAEYDFAFSYQGRAILYKEIKKDGYRVFIFLDTSLFSDEMEDFTERLEKKNNTTELRRLAEERFREKGKGRLSDAEFNALKPLSFKDAFSDRVGTGTLALRTNDSEINGVQAYCLYKRRQAIESFFKSYDNTFDFASSYMRDEYSEEAWLFLNHLSSIMAFSVMDEIYLKGKIKNVSLEDFISILSRIHADKFGGIWHEAKITKKRADFAKCFDLDISALVSSMNPILETPAET